MKCWVRVRVRNFDMLSSVRTELEPELSGIIGMPLASSSSCCCWPSVKPLLPGSRNKWKYAFRNSAVFSLRSRGSNGGGEKLLSEGTLATQRYSPGRIATKSTAMVANEAIVAPNWPRGAKNAGPAKNAEK